MAGSLYKILFCIPYLKSGIGDRSVISEPQGTVEKKVEKQKTSVSQCQNTTISTCSQRHLWLNPERKGRWERKECFGRHPGQNKNKRGQSGIMLGVSCFCFFFSLASARQPHRVLLRCQSGLEGERAHRATWNYRLESRPHCPGPSLCRQGSIACFCLYLILSSLFHLPSPFAFG